MDTEIQSQTRSERVETSASQAYYHDERAMKRAWVAVSKDGNIVTITRHNTEDEARKELGLE